MLTRRRQRMTCKKGGIIITDQHLSERCLYNVHLSDPERILIRWPQSNQMVIYDAQNGTTLIGQPKRDVDKGNPWIKISTVPFVKY